jgi:hypothetical protein
VGDITFIRGICKLLSVFSECLDVLTAGVSSSYRKSAISMLFICFLTPCSRVLLEKLTGSHLVNKFPAFYGTRKFITTFTSAHHLSLS